MGSKNLKIKVKAKSSKSRKTEKGNAQLDANKFGEDVAVVAEKIFKKKKGSKKNMGSLKQKKGVVASGREAKVKEIKIELDVDDVTLNGEGEWIQDDMVSNEVRRNKGGAFSSSEGAKLRGREIKVEVIENPRDTVLMEYAERSLNKKSKSKKSKAKTNENEQVPQIPSVDKDTSKGMKKWLNEYKKNRPGLKILQQNIDDFIEAYEAQEEKAKKEREAQAAEGGWTVVVHHKGRKKTTDSESGITVGSATQAGLTENLTKKKKKDAPLDFYRFQKREARRTEMMMLQSKFEQDKKRIQQLRAARKFKPY